MASREIKNSMWGEIECEKNSQSKGIGGLQSRSSVKQILNHKGEGAYFRDFTVVEIWFYFLIVLHKFCLKYSVLNILGDYIIEIKLLMIRIIYLLNIQHRKYFKM